MMRKLILLLLCVPVLFNRCDDEEEPFWHTDVAPDKTTTSMIPYQWTSGDLTSNNINCSINENYNSLVRCAWSTTSYDMNMDNVDHFPFDVLHPFQYTMTHITLINF
ncbi:hypothetical protein WBG78_30000 [Chryseolinea sp. T2]|uniref:hypothetical protein n=1 Tax=Chryseolinea sp. T2 TaxID=3129255 RepID=UPI003077674F